MSTVVPTRWWQLPPGARVVGRDGRPVVVDRVEGGYAWVDGRAWPVDVMAMVPQIVPSDAEALSGALYVMFQAWPDAEVLS